MVQLTKLSYMFSGVCEQVSLEHFIWLIVQKKNHTHKKNPQTNKNKRMHETQVIRPSAM